MRRGSLRPLFWGVKIIDAHCAYIEVSATMDLDPAGPARTRHPTGSTDSESTEINGKCRCAASQSAMTQEVRRLQQITDFSYTEQKEVGGGGSTDARLPLLAFSSGGKPRRKWDILVGLQLDWCKPSLMYFTLSENRRGVVVSLPNSFSPPIHICPSMLAKHTANKLHWT